MPYPNRYIDVFSPVMSSATTRRECRRQIRERLGVSSDPAPQAERVIKAAIVMRDLVYQATNGRIQIHFTQGGSIIDPRDLFNDRKP